MGTYRLRLAGILSAICLILAYHALFTAVQNTLPYPKNFGRETTVATVSGNLPAVPLEDGKFAFFDGESLVVQEFPLSRNQAPQKLPLPNPSFKQTTQYAFVGNAVFWISDNRLYLSRWSGETWQTSDLGPAVVFDVARTNVTSYLIVSDDSKLRVTGWKDDQMSDWFNIPIQDVAGIRALVGPNGYLFIASLADYGSFQQSFWWTEWDPVGAKVVKQSKIQSFHPGESRLVKDFELGMDNSSFYLFCALTVNGSHGQLDVIRLPFDDSPVSVADEAVMKGEVNGIDVQSRKDGEMQALVSADRQVFLVRFSGGRKVGEERISGKLSHAVHPIFVVREGEFPVTAVWLNRLDANSSAIEAASDDPRYLERMNHFRFTDFILAVKQLPGLMTGTVFALAASVKWMLPSFLYLAMVRVFGRFLRAEKKTFHFWMAVLLFLCSKLLFFDQFYSPQILLEMPVWMTMYGTRYLIPVVLAGLSLVLTGSVGGSTVRRRFEKDSAIRLFVRFVGLDVLLTVLWYGYYIR